MSTTTIVLGVIAAASLGVNVYQALLNRRRAVGERQAELQVESRKVHANAKAPAGWQLFVDVRNRGAATAYKPSIWIADAYGVELTHRFGDRGSLESGEAARLHADLPTPPTRAHHVWISWEDSRGRQERNTGIFV